MILINCFQTQIHSCKYVTTNNNSISIRPLSFSVRDCREIHCPNNRKCITVYSYDSNPALSRILDGISYLPALVQRFKQACARAFLRTRREKERTKFISPVKSRTLRKASRMCGTGRWRDAKTWSCIGELIRYIYRVNDFNGTPIAIDVSFQCRFCYVLLRSQVLNIILRVCVCVYVRVSAA